MYTTSIFMGIITTEKLVDWPAYLILIWKINLKLWNIIFSCVCFLGGKCSLFGLFQENKVLRLRSTSPKAIVTACSAHTKAWNGKFCQHYLIAKDMEEMVEMGRRDHEYKLIFYFAAKQKHSCYHHFDEFFDRTLPSKITFRLFFHIIIKIHFEQNWVIYGTGKDLLCHETLSDT